MELVSASRPTMMGRCHGVAHLCSISCKPCVPCLTFRLGTAMARNRRKIVATATTKDHGRKSPPTVAAVLQSRNEDTSDPAHVSLSSPSSSAFKNLNVALPSAVDADKLANRVAKAMRRKAARSMYLWAAVASSVGFTSLAGAAVYYRFVRQMQATEAVPYIEVLGTFSLAVGAAVSMEYWARWAHRALWHASLWHMHKSHHLPRDGPFELNDVFVIMNAAPAMALLAYGFSNAGLVPGLCLGAGLGITMFGMAYMFVHDGLVHRRFPVGPIADVPYLQKVAAAHQLHHANLFGGVPYGLFLGPKELEKVGGLDSLAALMTSRQGEPIQPVD